VLDFRRAAGSACFWLKWWRVRATAWEFKHRAAIFGIILGVSFSLYSLDPVNSASVAATWLALPLKMPSDTLTRLLLAIAAALMILSAGVRTWASAYLNAEVVYASEVKSARLVADGPYRHVRNPLYLGNVLMALSMGALMSRLGFVVVVIGMLFFCYRLILQEESELRASQSASFNAYVAAVPRLWFSPWPKIPSAGSQPHWGNGFLAESWCWGLAASVLVFAATLNSRVFYIVLAISLVSFWVSSSLAEKRAAAGHG
jgi:protein-S-isoprenylcysteine O-methyltransferase Ste14